MKVLVEKSVEPIEKERGVNPKLCKFGGMGENTIWLQFPDDTGRYLFENDTKSDIVKKLMSWLTACVEAAIEQCGEIGKSNETDSARVSAKERNALFVKIGHMLVKHELLEVKHNKLAADYDRLHERARAENLAIRVRRVEKETLQSEYNRSKAANTILKDENEKLNNLATRQNLAAAAAEDDYRTVEKERDHLRSVYRESKIERDALRKFAEAVATHSVGFLAARYEVSHRRPSLPEVYWEVARAVLDKIDENTKGKSDAG